MSTNALLVEPLAIPPDVDLVVPGSKSQTNRALLCAALAEGRSELTGALFAEDTEAMMSALAGLGVTINRHSERAAISVVGGVGGDTTGRVVDVRKSGTTGRFLLPVLATVPGRHVLDGDPQLRSRPFGPQLDALRRLGADIEGERLPLTVTGRTLGGGRWSVDGAVSSQFLSGLLMAAPRFAAPSTIEVDGPLVSQPYVTLTIATMASFGQQVAVAEHDDPGSRRYTVRPGSYRPAEVRLEPDASAASYFFAAAAVTGGRVRVNGLGADTVQGDLGFVDVLAKMGADVEITAEWTEVRGGRPLAGVTVDMADLSDTAQTLAVVATFADSPTEVTGIGFIRNKETDRVAAVETELRRRGIDVTSTGDGWIIRPGVPTPGRVATYDDHRMAMSFALLGLVHPGIEIEDPGCVSKTFPDYFAVLDRLRR